MNEFEKILEDLKFDEEKINSRIRKVNNELKKYIKEKILPEYKLNDGGHNSEHIRYVLKRAFELIDGCNINYDILYTCVCFHDVACHIDRDNHEVLSAQRAYEDDFLNGFFSIREMEIIREAIEDHRASLEYIPRNIYGRILSSADRKVEVKQYLIASISYEKKKNPEIDKNSSIEKSYQFAIKKFGKDGYAVNKSYVEDLKYKSFLKDVQYLIDNKELFIELAGLIYDKLYMVINSDRLILRSYEYSDVTDLVEGLNNIEVSKWMAGVPFPYTEEDAKNFIDRAKSNNENVKMSLAIVLKENNKVIGGTEITNINKKDGTAGGGIWLNEKYQNNGYGTEAFSTKIKYCFDVLGLRRIENGYFLGNERSRKMQMKLGYKDEGVRRKKFLCLATNEYVDECITGLLKEEFIEY